MSDRPDTKYLLIEATIAAISYGGESSVRVSAIAHAVGVKEPSVYHFFKTREELIEAAQIERYRHSYQEMIVPFAWVADMAQTAEEFAWAVRRILALVYSEDRVAIRAVRANVVGAAQTNEAIARSVVEINHEVATSLVTVLSHGQSNGWLTQEYDALSMAYWFIGQLNGRVIAEMNSSTVNMGDWDKISIEAVMGFFQTKNLP